MTLREPKPNRWAGKAHHIYRSGETVDGRFAVLRPLAAGGMAEVYEALDTTSGEMVALKTPNQRYADDPKIVDRMIREARALAVMPHPSLVQVVDAGSDDGQFYFVMELLDGQTLKELQRSQVLPLGVALSIVKQLAAGLHGLHSARMIHRDMKPDNVMVMEAPDKPEHAVKIFDLGIAKFLDASTTSQGLALGTLSYMAPEQAFGGKIDLRCDIYALGLMLYELIAHVHPLCIESRPQTAQEWASRQRDLEPPRLDAYLPGTHPLVSNLVAKAIAKDPAQRWPSAKELAIQIEAVMQTLVGLGKIDSLRLERFRRNQDGAAEQSGPQPILVARPPNASTPHAGMAYRRTDQAEDREPPPVALRPEPPRVAAQPSARTPRGTIPMVGPKGTKPLLDVRPNLAYAEALRSHASEERPETSREQAPSNDGEASLVDDSASRRRGPDWRAAPADSLRLARAEDEPEDSAAPRAPSEEIARAIEPLALIWQLKAVALGLAVACIGIGVAALILAQERRDAGPAAIPIPSASTVLVDAPTSSKGSTTLSPAPAATPLAVPSVSASQAAPLAASSSAGPTRKLTTASPGPAPRPSASASSPKPGPKNLDGPIDIFGKDH